MRINKYFILVVLLLFTFNTIKAEEDGVSCKYKLDGKEDTIIKVIYTDKEQAEKDTEVSSSETYGDIWFPNTYSYYPSFSGHPMFTDDYEGKLGALQYMNENSGTNKICPPHIYIFSATGAMAQANYALFSDIDYALDKIGARAKATISPDSNLVEDNEGNINPTADKTVYVLSNNNSGFPYTVTVSINYTDKTIDFSTKFNSVDDCKDYIKNFDYSNKNKVPEDLMICYSTDPYNSYSFIKTKSDTKYEGTAYACDDLKHKKDIEITPGSNGCDKFITLKDLYNSYYKSKDYSNTKTSLQKLKKYCGSIVKNNDYDDYEFSCINLCLNISDYLPGIEFNSGTCGFSERLILWIANIIRWVKYIVPVVVIVLGILDFMKAISADKEDEMKKAQQRFIRRLIAAALIFIVPFIIEFILNKMGFDSNGCGIINL